MFIRLVAAMVTADAIDRHIKDQRRAAVSARAAAREQAAAPVPAQRHGDRAAAWLEVPERPR